MPKLQTMPMAESSRIFPFRCPPLDSERRHHGEYQRAENGVQTEIIGYAYPAERGMRYSSAQEDHATGHDIGADDTADDTRKHRGRHGMLQKAVFVKCLKKSISVSSGKTVGAALRNANLRKNRQQCARQRPAVLLFHALPPFS